MSVDQQVATDTAGAAAETDSAAELMGGMGGGMESGMADPSSWTQAIDGAIGSWYDIFDSQRESIGANPCYWGALLRETIQRLGDLQAIVINRLEVAALRAEREQGQIELLGVDRLAAAVALHDDLYEWALAVRLGEARPWNPFGAPPFAVIDRLREWLPSGMIPDANSSASAVVNPSGTNSGIGIPLPWGGVSHGVVKIGSGIYFDRTVGELRGTRVYQRLVQAGELVDLGAAAAELSTRLQSKAAQLEDRLADLEADLAVADLECKEFLESERTEARLPLLLVAGVAALWVLRR